MSYPIVNLGASTWRLLQPYGGWGAKSSEPPPVAPPPPPPPPQHVREFYPIGAYDRFELCKPVRWWNASSHDPQARQSSIDAFTTYMKQFPPKDHGRIIDYMKQECPSPDFYYNLVGLVQTAPTPPYVSYGKPVATGERRRVNTAFNPPAFQPSTIMTPSQPPPVTSIRIGPAPPAPMEIPRPGAFLPPLQLSPGPGQCPPGQFWDGLQCRGSVGQMPGIPGGMVATPGGGGAAAAAFPGLTMGRIQVVNL